MSTITETVLLSMKADFSDLISASSDLKDQTTQLSTEIKKQREELKALEVQGKANTQQYKDLSKELTANEQSLKAVNKQQSVVNKSIQDGVQFNLAQKGSIVQLRAEYNRMKDAYINLSAAERDNKEIGGQMLDQLSLKNKKLKELESAYGDNRRNVGNYKDAVVDMVGELRIAGINIGTLTTQFTKFRDGLSDSGVAFNSFNGLLKASAIGIVITLFAGLIAAMTKFKPVADKVEQVFSGINAAVSAVIESLIKVGLGLISIAEGKFEQGVNQIRTSFDGLGASMKKAYDEGSKFAEMQQVIDDKTRNVTIANSKLNKEIDQLLLRARNRTLSDKERLSLLDQASAKEKEAFKNTQDLAKAELALAEARYAEAERTMQMTDQIEDARANAIANINRLESESLNLQEKIATRRDTLLQEGKLEAQKAAEAKIKAEKDLAEASEFYSKLSAKISAEQLQKEIQDMDSATQAKISLSEKEANEILAIRKLTSEELAKLALKSKEDQIKYINEIKNAELDSSRAKTEAAIGAANAVLGALGSLSQLAADNARYAKELAIAQAIIDTIAGATKAFAQGGVLGFITGGAVIVAGMANVAKIASTPIPQNRAAGGGSFMTKGPTTLLVGDNPGGVERVTVEPISGYGQTYVNPQGNLVAMAGGGTLTTDGGFARRNSGNVGFDYDELAKSLSKTNILVKVTDINKVNKSSKGLVNVTEIN